MLHNETIGNARRLRRFQTRKQPRNSGQGCHAWRSVNAGISVPAGQRRVETAFLATSNRISVGIDESDFAEAQFPDSRFDLGAIADHHPHEVIRMDHLPGGSI